MSESEKTNDMIGTTDCLEAVSAFKAMKNFLFVVIMVCLLLLQGIFWLDRTGYVEKCPDPCSEAKSVSCNILLPLAAVTEVESEIRQQAEAAVSEVTDAPAEPEQISEPVDSLKEEAAETEKPVTVRMLLPKPRHIATCIKVCNFVLIIAATLYCLILLMIIKISLVGRLGGISHISRAFFFSLFALILLMPWQIIFPSVIVGVIYTPKELLCGSVPNGGVRLIGEIFSYLRFSAMWLIAVLLFVLAQIRSAKWSTVTLRRLGIIN